MKAQTASALPLITLDSWDQIFDRKALYQLEPILPKFIAERRWFRAKARAIQCIAIADAIPVPVADSCILVLRIQYADQGCDHYLLPVSFAEHTDSDELLAKVAGSDGPEKTLYGALSNAKFRDALLNAIRSEEKFDGHNGAFLASRTNAFQEETASNIDSFVSRAEQSNTSVIYRDRYILKLFRKIEPGINPDVEIGTFLTARGFKHTPAVLGAFTYRAKGGDAITEYAAGLLQAFVPNQGDAWKYTLESLTGFFERTANQPAPPHAQHPFELLDQPIPADVRKLLGDYADSGRLLGRRTAEMHAALTDPNADSDFAPEPFTEQDAETLYEEMLGQAGITFELLRRKEAALTGEAAEAARNLLRIEHRVTERFAALRSRRFNASRIRYHGDYHLGQVLYTGDDFMIIDFEGEPMRPLAHRRTKTLAMRDVAGMIRSFQYAAYSAPNASSISTESYADYWTVWASAAFLNAYFEEARGHPFVPQDRVERKILFDAFLLQKALYEVAYELNNRPDWVRIPLRGILGLLA